MVSLIPTALLLVAGGGAPNPVKVWLSKPGGMLTLATREAVALHPFDAYPKPGRLLVRGGQVAFADGNSLAWVTGANRLERVPAAGRLLVGWQGAEPLVWDGKSIATLSGMKVPWDAQTGETPVFASLSGNSGTLVSNTASGRIKIAAIGGKPFAADFGQWTLSSVRMVTATSGFCLLVGRGSAVVRIRPGRAEIVAMSNDRNLGLAVASDGRAYLTRHSASDGEGRPDETEVDEIMASGLPVRVARFPESGRLVDLDRANSRIYVVRGGATGPLYERLTYNPPRKTVNEGQVAFVVPAFGGAGLESISN
ncbi:MAG: hypothetical protein ACYC96_02195 [Fimbriimonadaceae bacterium]